MKQNLFFTAVAAALFFAACSNEPKQAEESETPETVAKEVIYTIATDSASIVEWKGVMLGIKEHTGTADFTSGSITVKGGQVTGGTFTVDMTSLKTTDSNYDEATGYGREKLIGHLSAPDFFDVANYPTATFSITSVNGNEAKGTLTVRGKSNEETVKDINITEADGTVTAKGTLTFDRKKYNVAFDMASKEMVISNDIVLDITLFAKR